MRVTGTQYQNSIPSFQPGKHIEDKVDGSSREEISVIVEISPEGQWAIALKEKSEFSNEIVALDRSANYLPEYSGIYDADKEIATAVENCSHGSNLVYTTDALDVMKTMDADAYSEYQKISKESSNEDRALNALKYLTNWYSSAVSKNPHMLDRYEEKTDEYMEETVKNQKLDTIFENISTESRDAFINSLRQFQKIRTN